MSNDTKFIPRGDPVYAWRYLGQPRGQWPKWFRDHFNSMFANGSLDNHKGRYAVATIENERKTFWRWFDADKFEAFYIEEPRP